MNCAGMDSDRSNWIWCATLTHLANCTDVKQQQRRQTAKTTKRQLNSKWSHHFKSNLTNVFAVVSAFVPHCHFDEMHRINDFFSAVIIIVVHLQAWSFECSFNCCYCIRTCMRHIRRLCFVLHRLNLAKNDVDSHFDRCFFDVCSLLLLLVRYTHTHTHQTACVCSLKISIKMKWHSSIANKMK